MDYVGFRKSSRLLTWRSMSFSSSVSPTLSLSIRSKYAPTTPWKPKAWGAWTQKVCTDVTHVTETMLSFVFCKQWSVSCCVSSTDIDQLITISGMVIRTSQLIPEMQEAFFQCQVCAYSTRVEVDRGRIAEPAVCRHCNTTHSLALIHNRSVFSDKQMVRVCSYLATPYLRIHGW